MTTSEYDKNHAVVVDHYARLAPKYDQRWDRYSRSTLTAMLDQIDPQAITSLLDVACGTGIFAKMVQEMNPEMTIIGTDLSPHMIEMAKKRLAPSDTVKWLVAPAESLPVEDASVDVLTCANAFHLVADPDASMAEFHRVLKPDGSLVIVDWCREFFYMKFILRLSRIAGKQYRRIRTRDELAQLMTSSGFKVTHQSRFKATWFWGMMTMCGQRQ
jgi:ubiquinone/menaquinone biosynthesis C-methylase UbiE